MKLKDQVAIVTGGGGGIGEGICLCLAREGACVVVSDQNLGFAEETAAKVVKAGAKALPIQTDVRDGEQCRAMIQKTIADLGRLDILICNAGVDGLPLDDSPDPHLIENIRDENWNHVMDVNLKGVFNCCKAAVPHFKKGKRGRIVNIASVAGRQGVDVLLPYAASKAGVISFTQSLALQLAPYHINVNTVCPGIIWTPMWKRLTLHLPKTNALLSEATSDEVFQAVVAQTIPFGKPQTAEDIGNAVVFFASDEAMEITGQALNVCGGMRMN
jgi:meso-butanediol dehydrogenase / (S,S)-butanediol dehydrogenase / diacetyl reductase